MTRLISKWLHTRQDEMAAYGAAVEALTGVTPMVLAARAAARMKAADNSALSLRAERSNPHAETPITQVPRAGVVRVTTGLGVIGGFAESVAALLAWLGADVVMPAETDVDGIYSAARDGAEIIFLADDDRFIALNLASGTIAENDECTAYGYAEALDLMAGGMEGGNVLLLGYGRVGRHAMKALQGLGARVTVYDKDPAAIEAVRAEGTAGVCGRGDTLRYRLIFDATNEGGWLTAADLHPEALISSPGIPQSLDESAKRAYNGRIFSDVLQTGVAVMLSRVRAR